MSTEKDKSETILKKFKASQHPPANRVLPETGAKPGSVKAESTSADSTTAEN